jgi:hypothetical protein
MQRTRLEPAMVHDGRPVLKIRHTMFEAALDMGIAQATVSRFARMGYVCPILENYMLKPCAMPGLDNAEKLYLLLASLSILA